MQFMFDFLGSNLFLSAFFCRLEAGAASVNFIFNELNPHSVVKCFKRKIRFRGVVVPLFLFGTTIQNRVYLSVCLSSGQLGV